MPDKESDLPPLDEYAFQPQKLKTGVELLQQRQKKLSFLVVLSMTIVLISAIGFFIQQDVIYSFFGLSTEVQQLHMPASVDATLANLGQQPDYFFSLLNWLGWLILKLSVSFIGAFVLVHVLKKIRFFYIRFQSFVLKFVAWLLSFIFLWSALSYVQHDRQDDTQQLYSKIVHYEKHIQESELARYLKDADMATPVKAYLLAQTALMHHPADKDAAIPQVLALVKAEQQDPQFLQYGFKPEQLWTMQQQVYGKALTPMAQSVHKQVQQAEQLNTLAYYMNLAVMVLMLILTAVLWFLSRHLQQRILRIQQQLE